MPDALQEIDVLWSVVAAAAATLHRLYLRKACFPETQDMLRQVEVVCDFADGAKGIRALLHRQPPRAPYSRLSLASRHISTVCRGKFKSSLQYSTKEENENDGM